MRPLCLQSNRAYPNFSVRRTRSYSQCEVVNRRSVLARFPCMVEQKVRRVVVLSGAGISAESGVATFRAADGLWEEHRIEDVATNDGFQRDPELVHRFYNARRRLLVGDEQLKPVTPNAAHLALSHFETFLSAVPASSFLLVTQNVDNLHEQAASTNIRH